MNSGRCPAEASVLAAARAAGACAAGFARVEPVDEAHVGQYRRWIARGCHAGMDYLEKYADVRDNPALLLDGARSILCLAFPYATADTPRHPLFADYALGRDYHEVLRKHLAPVAAMMEAAVAGSRTRICIDTAPLRERYWATKAGLGFIGLNNQLIIPGKGSAVFLAEILWTADAEPSPACAEQTCMRCGKCIEACPAGALDGIGALDARKCLSYLTIEHRGELPAGIRLPGRIYGCDICRHVCPYNSQAEPMPVLEEFRPSEAMMRLRLPDIADMEQEQFSALFSHSAVRRAKLAGLKRNAQAAMGTRNTEPGAPAVCG